MHILVMVMVNNHLLIDRMEWGGVHEIKDHVWIHICVLTFSGCMTPGKLIIRPLLFITNDYNKSVFHRVAVKIKWETGYKIHLLTGNYFEILLLLLYEYRFINMSSTSENIYITPTILYFQTNFPDIFQYSPHWPSNLYSNIAVSCLVHSCLFA